MKATFPLFICIFIYVEALPADPICEGKEGFICCSGFKWHDVLKKCIRCSSGYFGHNCSHMCSFPTYGEMCKYNCTCDRLSCFPEFGCLKETVQTTHTQTIGKEVGTTNDGLEKYADSNFKQLLRKTSINNKRITSSAFNTKEEKVKEKQLFFSEEKNKHIIESNVSLKSEKEKDHTMLLATLIGVLAILFLVVSGFVFILVKMGVKKCRTSKDNKSLMSADSDHYDNLNSVDQALLMTNDEGLIFEGLAEVRFNYDSEREHYLFGFQSRKGGQTLSYTTENPQKIETDKTDGRSKTTGIHNNKNFKGTESYVRGPEQLGYLEMRDKSTKPSTSNPYLMAVSDDYLSDGASLEKDNSGYLTN